MNSATIDLSPERWSRIQQLFDAAMGIEPEERRAFLQAKCGDDDELFQYLGSLLRVDPGIDATIEQTILESVTQVFGDDDEADAMRGEMIGPYRVERLLGSGGMGMVYLAERADEQFDQQVAIKLGRHRLVDPQTELRLRAERQILADLDHPGIARLFDGGTTQDGVPYLVMEYIDGIRIDAYCDVKRTSIEERLRLFQAICGAVHYAHQNLIIHRDIKPANILVTDDGMPKLLDFGIAKLTDEAGAATDGLTREGAVIMTPANAAPEQILGRPVTTSTDVYALGLLLYRLLSGVQAFDTDNVTPSEFARMVCNRDPVAPSQCLEQQQASVKREIANDRGTAPERLRRRLRGDLDTIVLNALRKDPERRYRSASALADDIQLHLKSMPIVARSESWRYRAGKFVRRHYAGVGMSVIAAITLVAFTVVVAIQNKNITLERDIAREVTQVLEDTYLSADPAQARGVDITAKELLAAGAERIREDLADQPELQAALMGTIGRLYFNRGAYEPSLDMLEQALALRLQARGNDHPDVAAAQNDLAKLLIRRADYDRADELLQDALQINQRNIGPTSKAVAENLFFLAEVRRATGQLDDAERYADQSIDIYEPIQIEHGVELAEAKSLLARILQLRGELGPAEILFREAIDIVERDEGPDHPLMAYYLQNLGVLLRSKGDLEGAEEVLGRAIEVTRRVLGEDHDLLAATLIDRGRLLHAKGDYEQATAVMGEALAIDSQKLGDEHPRIGYDLTVLAMVFHDASDLVAAENALRDALKIFDVTLEKEHQYTASALTELGAILNATGRLDEAQALLERALAIRIKDYSPEHELVAATRVEYADMLTRRGRYDEAEPLLMQSLETLSERPGRRQQRVAEALARLSALQAKQAD